MRCPPVSSRRCSRKMRSARRICSSTAGRTASFAGLRECQRDPAQVAARRPPVPRRQGADVGDCRDVHSSFACAAANLVTADSIYSSRFDACWLRCNLCNSIKRVEKSTLELIELYNGKVRRTTGLPRGFRRAIG